MLKYKNFDLALFFRGVVGNKVLNLTRWAYGPQASQSSNVFIKDAVGSNVSFRMNYNCHLNAMTSSYVEKVII